MRCLCCYAENDDLYPWIIFLRDVANFHWSWHKHSVSDKWNLETLLFWPWLNLLKENYVAVLWRVVHTLAKFMSTWQSFWRMIILNFLVFISILYWPISLNIFLPPIVLLMVKCISFLFSSTPQHYAVKRAAVLIAGKVSIIDNNNQM